MDREETYTALTLARVEIARLQNLVEEVTREKFRRVTAAEQAAYELRAAISSVRALHAEPHECPEWDDAHGWVTGWFSGGGCPTIAALDSSGTVEDAPGSRGAELIAAERQRQMDAEGWTPEHDAAHTGQQLAWAAVCYATPPDWRRLGYWQVNYDVAGRAAYPAEWPWHPDYWKPGDRVRELVKAGALIAAEIDRLSAQLPEERSDEPEEGRPNAEDCPRCDINAMSYPFICPGHPAPESSDEEPQTNA